MIVDITNEVLTKLKSELPDIVILTSYQNATTRFPTIIVEEVDNSADIFTKDSSGFQYSNIALRIEIYTKGTSRMSEAKNIRGKIDNVLSNQYGMTRGKPMVVPNFLDETIYKYVLTYTGKIDKDKNIFRG